MLKPAAVEELMDFALELAELASMPTTAYFRCPAEVENKEEQGYDPVTAADREAEKRMREHIEARFPDHGIHGEEFGEKPTRNGFTWVLDPIDGTRAYVCGLPTWMTLIGLMHDNNPVLGVAHQPVTDDLFFGSANGSFLRHKDHTDQLTVRPAVALSQALAGTTRPGLYRDRAEQRFLQQVQQHARGFRFDADAYFYCLVAAGHMDVAMDARLQAYDIAALIPIIEGAGGRVTTFSGGNPAQGGNVFATTGAALHDELLELWAQISANPGS